MKLLPLCVLTFVLGWWSAQPAETDVYSGHFLVKEEQQYGPGIQFFALQRIESKDVDRAVCSIDGSLPLAKALHGLNGQRVRITLADAGLRTLER